MKNLHAFCASLLTAILFVGAFEQAASCLPGQANAANTAPAQVETVPVNLIQKAYSQIRDKEFSKATKTLCTSIRTEGDSLTARRYLSYVLLQQGLAEDALKQMTSLANPTAFDLFMKGVAFEMTANPTTAVDWFRAAVEKDPQNTYFRNKAIDSLIGVAKYDDAILLCADGSKLATDAQVKSFYEEKMKKTKTKNDWLAKASEDQMRRKSQHLDSATH